MKKFVSFIVCICLLLTAIIIPVSASETVATISFDDKAYRTEFSTSIQVWEQNGIKVTNNKGGGSSIADYIDPVRFYKNSEVIVEYSAMTKIVVTAASATYAKVWSDSNNDANANVTIDGSVATIEFDEATNSFALDSLSAQSRVDSITVYTGTTGGTIGNIGTYDNPDVIELEATEWDVTVYEAETYLDFYEGDKEYYFKTIAPASGVIGVNIYACDYDLNNIGYSYNIENINSSTIQSITRTADDDDYNHYELVCVDKGDEILICASTYNPANTTVAPEGELGLYMCFYPVGSIEYPEQLQQTGVYTATLQETSQGRYYTWIVPSDGTVTVTMNDTTGWQYRVNKVPVNIDDTANYYYSDIHSFDDANIIACETINVLAGEIIDIWVNTFNPADEWVAPAGNVGWTLEFKEKTVGIFSVQDVDALPGEEFTVAINISDNPGIVGAKLDVNYNPDIMELIDVQAGDFANDAINVGDEVLFKYHFSQNLTDCPYVINWIDPLATENTTTNGAFAYLIFRVKDSAVAGETQISIALYDDDIYDKDLNDVTFVAVNSNVTITAIPNMSGDINDDGNVNARDCAMLMQYINNWSDIIIDEDAADVNADKKINARDYVVLMRYINGWDIELK